MPKGSLLDIGKYRDNTTNPLEIEYNKSVINVRNAETYEQSLYTVLAVDSYTLISSALRTIKAIVQVTKVSIRNAKIVRAAMKAGSLASVPTGGVSTGIGLGVTAGLAGHVLYALKRCRKRIKRLLRMAVKLVAHIAEWQLAVEGTDTARNVMADVEKQLLAARMESAEFARRIVACKRRITDHKDGVMRFYKRIVDAGLLGEDDVIPDMCASHDDDKMETFNLARQALRFVTDDEKVDNELYLSMMRCVVEEHVHSNEHHPEFWSGSTVDSVKQNASKMPLKYIGEMCADWAAMSEEMGTSLLEWEQKVVDRRWLFTDEQKKLIHACCTLLDPYTKEGKRNYGYKYYDPGATKALDTDIKEESINVVGSALLEGAVPPKDEIIGAIKVLLNLIGGTEDSVLSEEDECVGEDGDVVLDGDDELDDGYTDPGVSDTVETEDGMNAILDEMGVPGAVRDIAPQLLNNIVQEDDGSFKSVDGSVVMGDSDSLWNMLSGTLNAIAGAVGDSGHANVSIGDDLSANVTTRDQYGHRREVTVEPVREG